MRTKTLLIAFAACLFASSIFAQTTSFGLRGGVNFQNINGKDILDNKLKNKATPGFNIGVNAEIPVGIDFYVQPGILFTTKGAKLEDSDDKIALSYIEVPINFIYKPAIGTGRLIMGFGPYVAFAVDGKYKPEDGDDVDIKFKSKVTTDEYLADPYLKRIDAGGNLLFGYEFANKLSLQLNAQLGLININPKIEGVDDDPSSSKNTGFGVSLGYRF